MITVLPLTLIVLLTIAFLDHLAHSRRHAA